MKTPTYLEIASDWRLWIEYVDPGAVGSEQQFNQMTIDERVAFIEQCFGKETDAEESETMQDEDKSLEELRDDAMRASTHSGAEGQYGYARSLQMNREDSGGPPMSDYEAWKLAGKCLR